MSEPSLNTEPIPANVESVQPAAAILVSCVKNAFDTSTQHYEAKEIIDRIRSEELRVPIATIRREFSDNMASTGNDRKAVKNAIAERKKRLPGAIWSGTFGCRVQPVEDHLLQHSGLLGADLDGLGNELAEIRTKLTNSLHLWALFLSPSGDGLKCVFRVPAQAEKHFASFRAVEEHVRELCGRKIDQSCSDVSRLCFLTHDPDAYLNENAIELPPLPEAERRDERVAPSVQNDPEIGIRQSIAAELVGEIQWASDTRGFCACPAHHLHTTGDGKRDCQVRLDGAPTIYCFHDHCRGIIEGANYQLRSRIGQAERSEVTAHEPGRVSPPFELPHIVSLDEFLAEPIEMPEVLVDGLIRKRSVVMVASSSKSYKTWTVLHLALCVSQGIPWLGRKVAKGRVLFLNFELTPAELQSRLSAIANTMGGVLGSNFDICNLRGLARDIAQLIPEVIKQCEGKNYAVIVPDPIYSMMGKRNEIAANEMADFLNHLSQLSEATGAAIIYTHHFAKGNAAKKEQIDRASGSGVFSRHADGIITLTRHKEDNAFTVEAELRSFRRPAPFVIKWEYPTMEIVDLDPTQLKNKAGRTPLHTMGELLGCLKDGMTAGEWIAEALRVYGISKSTFYTLRKEAHREDRIYEKDTKWFRRPKPVVVQMEIPREADGEIAA